MRAIITLVLSICLFASVNAISQTQPKAPKTIAVITESQDNNLVYKNEAGKVLTLKQAMDYVHTGDYKMERAIDKNKKPYILVKKSPGYNRQSVAEPIIIKP